MALLGVAPGILWREYPQLFGSKQQNMQLPLDLLQKRSINKTAPGLF